MSEVGSIAWFARHELRLAWRDWRMLMARRGVRRSTGLIIGGIVIVLIIHAIAKSVLHPMADLATAPSKRALVMITAILAMSFSLMLSQAMEAVTRAFYTRADLELILSSPAASWKLFAVRIASMAVLVMSLSLLLSAPFINVMVWRAGWRWLAAYPAMLALAMVSVALAVVLTVLMFQVIGPKRTRLIAQIVSAIIGALFIIGLQFAAILSYGTMNRLAFLESDRLTAIAPETDSLVWGATYAIMGHPLPFAALMLAGVGSLVAVILVYAPRFGPYAVAAASVARDVSHGGGWRGRGRPARFRNLSPAQALRRKEWALLRRDPWLVSQTLVQILYLLPAAFLLWSKFDTGIGVITLLVPILVTASGQFTGGLAWLAVAGEDAPELVDTAPLPAARVLRAKIEAVMSGTFMVFGPFLLVLALLSVRAALIAAFFILVAGASAMAIQFWYRMQAYRGRIRRRQTASRLTTFTEAFSSIGWAATAAFAAAGLTLVWIPGVISLGIVALAWWISPARAERARGGGYRAAMP